MGTGDYSDFQLWVSRNTISLAPFGSTIGCSLSFPSQVIHSTNKLIVFELI